MKSSERRKLQWQDPAYRKMMSEAHKGNSKAKGAYSFPKGKKNPNYDPVVAEKLSECKKLDKNPMWNGGETITDRGYRKVKMPDSSMADSKGYVFEHRKVMAEYLGRDLEKNEVVHHIDMDTLNNDINNLMLFDSVGDHTRHHHQLKGQVMPV